MSPSSVFFSLAGEDTTVKFQSVTGLSPIVSDSFPKIIGMCLDNFIYIIQLKLINFNFLYYI